MIDKLDVLYLFCLDTNSILRRIDLCCKILAPILVGQIMTYVSKVAGVIVLAGWNVLSVFLEYYLLWKVFQSVSALSQKVLSQRHQDEGSSVDLNHEDSQSSRERLDSMESEDLGRGQNGAKALVPDVDFRNQQMSRKPGIFLRIKKRILTFKNGWHIYFRQAVARPGLALASLYFTVISFGAITTGYAYTQCMTESLLSIIRGVGSLFGVLATFAFPRLRNFIGVVRCGLFSMSLQFSCLLLCVAAVFAPGSPFFLLPRNSGQVSFKQQCSASPISVSPCTLSNLATPSLATTLPALATSQGLSNTSVTVVQPSSSEVLTSFYTVYTNYTVSPTSLVVQSSFVGFREGSSTPSSISPARTRVALHNSSISPQHRNCSEDTTEAPTTKIGFSHVSIGLLLAGVVTSRLGLWMSDLTISQLFQETVPEQERGIVAGMQNSFNSVLGLAMFFLVIALPKPEHFGLLVLMSVSAVGTGGLLYASFAYKVRGHLFHLDKFRKCLGSAAEADNDTLPISRSGGDLDFEDDEEEAMIKGVQSTRNENFKY